MANPLRFLTPYLRVDLLRVLVLGILSGLPLALTASTLTLWLSETGLTLSTIGLFSLVAVPYSLKFIWAPLIDSGALPGLKTLGRRRSWLFMVQGLLAASLYMLAISDPTNQLMTIAVMALLVAFASASQDIIIDAWRIETLTKDDQGYGAAMTTLGYRIGMLISSAGALYISSFYGWKISYSCMAIIVLAGMIFTLFLPEPTNSKPTETRRLCFSGQLYQAVVMPFLDFLKRPSAWLILIFVVLYKLGDAMAGSMLSPLYVHLGFSKIEIANITKVWGFLATILGGFIGGAMVKALGQWKSLWLCGILQAVSNFAFSWLATQGHFIPGLTLAIGIENLTSGMGGIVFVAYLSTLCNVRFTATQYALLSSLAVVARTILASPAGIIAGQMGWVLYFGFSALMAIPGLLALWWLTKSVQSSTSLDQ